MADQNDDSEWEGRLVGCIGLGFLTAIATLAYQTWQFLQFGKWPALSLLSALRVVGSTWALDPQSWFGLYKVFDAIVMADAKRPW